MICQFCNNPKLNHRVIYKNSLLFAFPSYKPIVPGHTIICPIRHVETIDKLKNDELVAVKFFLICLKKSLRKSFAADGFNIAWNEGKVAGQSENHLHIHVVPRKKGDTGIYRFEPRKFLYRPGARKSSTKNELKEVANLIRSNLI